MKRLRLKYGQNDIQDLRTLQDVIYYEHGSSENETDTIHRLLGVIGKNPSLELITITPYLFERHFFVVRKNTDVSLVPFDPKYNDRFDPEFSDSFDEKPLLKIVEKEETADEVIDQVNVLWQSILESDDEDVIAYQFDDPDEPLYFDILGYWYEYSSARIAEPRKEVERFGINDEVIELVLHRCDDQEYRIEKEYVFAITLEGLKEYRDALYDHLHKEKKQ